MFDLNEYLAAGIEHLIKNAVKATLSNPGQSLFFAKYVLSAKQSAALRSEAEAANTHIPPFLIASITERCNLNCKGCYSKTNAEFSACSDRLLLSRAEWRRIFSEAASLGVGFILLAGGEPLLRSEILEEACGFPQIIFPVFTNGTLLGDKFVSLFSANRNLIPIISVEGSDETTDSHRGAGISGQISAAMEKLGNRGIMFGVSLTVTRENLPEATSDSFVKKLSGMGCKLILYVEYVPVDGRTELAPTPEDRIFLDDRLSVLRSAPGDIIYISFPGDEKHTGGCLAAGRGFFHINPYGGAEPCPFSPFSDLNLHNVSLTEAMSSPLFVKLRSSDILSSDHTGGCVLFGKQDQVRSMTE